jgi:hypothetical protein
MELVATCTTSQQSNLGLGVEKQSIAQCLQGATRQQLREKKVATYKTKKNAVRIETCDKPHNQPANHKIS